MAEKSGDSASFPSASPTGTRVKEKALPKLLNLLCPIVHSWALFARQIGVPISQVSQIRAASPPTGPSHLYTCLSQVLEWWVANHHNPTYEAIIAILDPKLGRKTPVMNRALASQVKKFMAKQEQAVNLPTTTSSTRGDLGGEGDDYTAQNIMIIHGKFAKLLQSVRTKLQNKLSADQIKGDFRLFILNLFPNISSDMIPNTSDLNEIFEAMRRNRLWSYMNYFPLEQIVKQFDSDEEITSEMEQFKKDRAGFQLATKIKDYISAANARLCEDELQLNPINPKEYTKLSLKLDSCVADYSLRYLEELWQSLSFHMHLPPIVLLFNIISSGSIHIVFLIPTKIVPQVICQAKYSAHFYRMHQIQSVTFGEKDSLFTMEMDIPIDSEPKSAESKKLEEGGYDCEFVEPPPPVGLKTHCTICLQILCEPHIISCCGNRFCQSCISHIKADGKSCPLCNATSFNLMHDKSFERLLNDLKVGCIHAISGCKWTGELRQLKDHLNKNPSSEKVLEGCISIEVKCIHCGRYFQRCQLIQHQVEECPEWPCATHQGITELLPIVDDSALMAAVGNPKLNDLVRELKNVYGWFQLGLCLDLSQDTLESIYADYRDSHNAEEKCKTKMLSIWIETAQQPTWSTIVTALRATRKPATATKLAAKLVLVPDPTEPIASCGDEHISENEIPLQIKGFITTPEQEVRVRELRDEVGKKDRELYKVNESITQCDKEWNMLSTDLSSMKEQQQFYNGYTLLLIEDHEKQRVKLRHRQDELRDVKKQAQQRPDTPDSDMEHLREYLQQKQKESDAVQYEIDRLQAKIKLARNDSSVLSERVHAITSEYEVVCHKRKELQSHKMELQAGLKKCEEDIDLCLLTSSNTTTPIIPHQAKAETSYYNVMLCGSRIEVKLRKSEIEQYENKIAEKETEVKVLREKLMKQQRQREQLEQHLYESQKEDKSSPDYDYAYAIAQYKREMEKYENERKLSDLWTENLEYRMQLDVVESQKHSLKMNLQQFMQELRSLESIQSKYQKQIKKRHLPENSPHQASKEFEEGADPSSTGVQPGSPEYVPYLSGQVGHPTLDFSGPSTTFQPRTEQPTEPAHEHSPRNATLPHSPHFSELAKSIMSEEELKEQDWYQDVSYEEAEERLQKCNKDGVYLVRPSGSSPSKLALSYCYRGQVINVRVQLNSVGKYHLGTDRAFDSIHELLEYYKKVSFNVFHGSVCQPGTTLTDICSQVDV